VPIGAQYLHIFIKIIAPNAIEYKINFGIFPLFCKIHFAIAHHMIGANSIYKRFFLTGTYGRINLRPKGLGQLYRCIANTTSASVHKKTLSPAEPSALEYIVPYRKSEERRVGKRRRS